MIPKLVLIDAHAILHRAYHALPPLTNKEGTQTNAIYGFMTMVLRLLSGIKPEYLAVCFDRPEPTFRKQIYTQYQGKRPEMEGNLAEQIPLLHELLDGLKISHFEVAGYEADDVIGTLAKQNSEETIIVTGDRDMLQLVNDKVKVLVPVKGLGETKLYDPDTVVEEFGVEPRQWVDVKALKGDSSDNYPGVPGIGPKTAQMLISKYSTLENLYGRLGELGKLGVKLAEGAESAGMSKKLATIVTDVPVHLDLLRADATKIDWGNGAKFMREKLGFKSIAGRVEREYLDKDDKAISPTSRQMELI
ncbi:MAG: 5'-3' exonuclease H3TH domain-containing protein [Patescibacteria group bacterium]